MWSYIGHSCLIFHLSLLGGGCIGAPQTDPSYKIDNAVSVTAVPPSAALSATTNRVVVVSTTGDDGANLVHNDPIDNAAAATSSPLLPPSSSSLRRSQRSVKEKDLVDYIAIEELERAQQQQHEVYVSSNSEGWAAADRLGGGWQLQPQVGKRPKRMRGQARMVETAMEDIGREAASTLLARQQRNGRLYDVPQIECPRSPDQTERFACPRPDRRGRFRCIDDRSLCDGFYDCPGKEDESPEHCLFYKTTKAHLDILAEALLRWARGR